MCCAASHYQGSVHSPYSFCLFILANVAAEEVAELVVGGDSGMYKAGFPGDDALRAVPNPRVAWPCVVLRKGTAKSGACGLIRFNTGKLTKVRIGR